MLHLARAVERRTPQGRQFRVAAIAEDFAHNLRQELDFPLEAANEIRPRGGDRPGIGGRIPFMYGELLRPRVPCRSDSTA